MQNDFGLRFSWNQEVASTGTPVWSKQNMNSEPPAWLKHDLKRGCNVSIEDELRSPDSAGANRDMLSRALDDRYRCPERFFDLAVSKQLSRDAGYFQFGPDAICYGRSFSEIQKPRHESTLHDAVKNVTIDGEQLNLPFDPTEIIDNLRLERYANTLEMNGRTRKFLRKMYYNLRPLTNLMLRKQVQKFNARGWRKRSFPHWPVDTTVEDICERLLLLSIKAKGVERVPFVWFWPDGAIGCFTMTHDVETKAGWNQCTDLMAVDDSFGIKAAFGIVPEGRYEVSSSLLEAMHDRGFEVAIQDLNHDGRLFDDKEEFQRRAKLINRYGREYGAKGFRAAILYRNPEWLGALEFAFDMSFPNVAPLDPQRGGCCTVMPFFVGDILELPVTTVQDYTLFHVLNEHSADLWKLQMEMILKKNGVVSFIVHPDYIPDPEKLAAYKSLLEHLRQLREKTTVWCALPSEINTWWRARNKMSLVKKGSSWQIEGDGAERAVVAYAKNVDGKLVYELPGTRRQ